jgi:hypothetical protein
LKNEGSLPRRSLVSVEKSRRHHRLKAIGEGKEHASSGDIRKHLGQAHQVVGCGYEAEGPCDAIHSSKPGLVLAGDRFDPAEGFLALKELFFDPVRALCNCTTSPRHDRYRRGRILWRALDYPVAIDHVDENITLHITSADDLHFFEKERASFSEDILTLFEFLLERDRAHLAA